MHVGLRIKKYLSEHGHTQIWLSNITGIRSSRLSMILSGKRRMSFEEYELICGALNVDTNTFIIPRKKDA